MSMYDNYVNICDWKSVIILYNKEAYARIRLVSVFWFRLN